MTAKRSRVWIVDQVDEYNVHVWPYADLIDHALTDDCTCGPTPEPTPRADGGIGWVVTHHSLDGRENGEAPK